MTRRTFIKKTLSIVAGVAVGLTATPAQCRENRNNGTTDDMFGVGVTMDPDGKYIVVGEHAEDDAGADQGVVYIFSFSGSDWVQGGNVYERT
jgi:hypothetical protein